MNLRRSCEHGRYDEHDYWGPVTNLIGGRLHCPGGVFLPDDTLVIEKVEALERIRKAIPLALLNTDLDVNGKWTTEQNIIFTVTIWDALSVREAE